MVSNEFRNMVRLAASGRKENEDMCLTMLVGRVLDSRARGMDRHEVPVMVASAMSVIALRRLMDRVGFTVEVRFEVEHAIIVRVLWPRDPGFATRWIERDVRHMVMDKGLLWDVGRYNSPDHDLQVMHKAVLILRQEWLDDLLSCYPAGGESDLKVSFAVGS